MGDTAIDQHEEYLADRRAQWRAAMIETLGAVPPARSEWSTLPEMVRVLQRFMGESLGHTYFPTGGGHNMASVALGREHGTLEMSVTPRAAYILRPTKLSIHYFTQAPAQSFIYITAGELKQTDVYEDAVIRAQEELVEVDGEYHERAVWDQGFIHLDEDGYEIPLPTNARLAIRCLRGNFLIAGNGSVWNGSVHTYDGEHDQFGEQGTRDLIQALIVARGLNE